MSSFYSELKRRNVLKVAAGYAVIAWIVIEAGSVLIPTFGGPDWIFQVYTVVVIAGFLIAVVFAWIFDLTPEGIKRTDDLPVEQSVPTRGGRKFDFVIIGLLIVALAISVTFNVTGVREVGRADEVGASVSRSIAVLPFTSRSTSSDNRFFADGVHDDLLTNLGNISSLKVISRTSVMEYRDTTKNLKQIGDELGVATVLEGAVQRVGDNVRINVQLIDAETDEHLWANSYDRELTTQNIFAIQTEISEQIAGALEAKLTREEQHRIKTVPTANLEAYNFYLAGRNNLYQRRLENLQQARAQFEQAIALDPSYAQAYSGLSDSLMLMFTNHRALAAEEAFPLAQAALDKALALETEDADIYASLGLLQMETWELTSSGPELDEAAAAFQRAIELNPNHAQAYAWYANVYERNRDLDKATELVEKAIELDPLARIPQNNLGRLYAETGRNQKALEQWLRTARLHPDWPEPNENIAAHLAALGRLDEAVAWYRKTRELSTDPLDGLGVIPIFVEFGELAKANVFIDSVPRDHPLAPLAVAFKAMIHEDYDAAVAVVEDLISQTGSTEDLFVGFVAYSAMLSGDFAKSREYFEVLWIDFADPARPPDINADNFADAIAYAYVLENLGEAERAEALLESVLGFLEDHHRMGREGYGIRDVQTLILLGRPEEALAALREAIDEGWRCSHIYNNWTLEDDPFLTSIRDHVDFNAMLGEIRADIDTMRRRVEEAEETGHWAQLLTVAEQTAL